MQILLIERLKENPNCSFFQVAKQIMDETITPSTTNMFTEERLKRHSLLDSWEKVSKLLENVCNTVLDLSFIHSERFIKETVTHIFPSVVFSMDQDELSQLSIDDILVLWLLESPYSPIEGRLRSIVDYMPNILLEQGLPSYLGNGESKQIEQFGQLLAFSKMLSLFQEPHSIQFSLCNLFSNPFFTEKLTDNEVVVSKMERSVIELNEGDVISSPFFQFAKRNGSSYYVTFSEKNSDATDPRRRSKKWIVEEIKHFPSVRDALSLRWSTESFNIRLREVSDEPFDKREILTFSAGRYEKRHVFYYETLKRTTAFI